METGTKRIFKEAEEDSHGYFGTYANSYFS
jgi:hypothetical protein